MALKPSTHSIIENGNGNLSYVLSYDCNLILNNLHCLYYWIENISIETRGPNGRSHIAHLIKPNIYMHTVHKKSVWI